ncbi:hypothetical protein D3Z45_21260 [Lachnospiraceae bacterium]|nr:hypothetical protein [Lachnospiraceae bacterium]
MRGKGRKRANWISNNIIAIIALFFDVFPLVISYFRNKEVSWGIFCVIINISVIFCIYKILAFFRDIFKQYKRYKHKRRKLKDEAERRRENTEKSEQGFDYGLSKEELWEEFVARCLAILVKRCITLFAFIGTIVLVCVCNPQNAHAYWSDVEKIMGLSSKEDNISDESNQENTDNESTETEEIVQEIRDTNWRFILGEPTYNFELQIQLKNQVFFENNKSGIDWEEYVQGTVEQWKGEKEGVDYITIEDEEGNDFFTYTEMEDEFKEKVENASQYMYYDEWLKEAPYSFEYDECIEGREILNKIEVDGKIGCYEIWWKLANDYQYYAQEYEQQTANAEAILYYYAKSIYCCMEALKYSVSEEEYNTTYHNMVMRYHDIYRDECVISQEYKEKAKSIFSILVKSDVKWSTDK